MSENCILILELGWLLFLLTIIVLIGWLGVKNVTLECLLGKLQILNTINITEVKEMLEKIIAIKLSFDSENSSWECAFYEKRIFRIRKHFLRKECSENSKLNKEEISILNESDKLLIATDNCVEETEILQKNADFPPEKHCEMAEEHNNVRKTEEKFVQTDEIESIPLPFCSNCKIRKETNGCEQKPFNMLTESDTKPGIYQPPIKRRESSLDWSSSQSSNGDNYFGDRKRSVEMDSDSDCSDWRKVPERKSQNPILFCEKDKNPPVGTSSPDQSPWSLLSLTNETRFINIRETQQNQANLIKKRKQYITEKDTRSPLIIGVDARPTIFSGYCLNLKTLVCQFYSFPSKYLPWKLHNENRKEGNSSEFEMKNMMFALLLWEKEIEKYEKFSIFTDNVSINHDDCQYGKAVTTFLEHLTGCKNYIRVNSNSHSHRKRNLEGFSRFIQPADDLSHFNFDHFKDFMKKTYGKVSFKGSHDFLQPSSQVRTFIDHYPTSSHHRSMLEKVTQSTKNWTTACKSCGFCFPMKSLNCVSKEKCPMEVQSFFSPNVEEEKRDFSLQIEDFPSL